MRSTDPVVKSKRVFKNAADKARQKRLEGANTPFQKRLRLAESVGENPFDFEGKSYAARTTAAKLKGPGTRRATRIPGGPIKPPVGTIPLKQGYPSPIDPPEVIPQVVPKVKNNRRRIGRFAIQPIRGGGSRGPDSTRKSRRKKIN